MTDAWTAAKSAAQLAEWWVALMVEMTAVTMDTCLVELKAVSMVG